MITRTIAFLRSLRPAALPLACLALFACAQLPKPDEARSEVEGELKPFFGDLHVHTELSVDAFAFGARTSLEDSYRFAQGEKITLADGREAQIDRPLDFLAVTDHSESFGEYFACTTPGHAKYDDPWCKRVRAADTSAWKDFSISNAAGFREKANGVCPSDAACRSEADAIWSRAVVAAERYNSPGRFTAFAGFEFSPSVPGGGMLHRNVIFAGKGVPSHALSATEVGTELELWNWLEQSCGGPCLAITVPHNMNFSKGYTFARETTDGRAYSEGDRERQLRRERLVEVTQIKGNSECLDGVGMTDEECSFELLVPACKPGQTKDCNGFGSDVRTGLVLGLRDAARGKINSLQPGFVGSTDTHNGLAGGTAEDRYLGATGVLDSSPSRRLIERIEDWNPEDGDAGRDLWKYTNAKPFRRNPGGLAGVWARANTRGDIFDAFVARQTFATSGTRTAVRYWAGAALPDRFFARGWNMRALPLAGVFPMGSSVDRLSLAGMRLAVEAFADPRGPGLHEIQIVKAWIDAEGKDQLRIYPIWCDGKPMTDSVGGCSTAKVQPGADCKLATGGVRRVQRLWTDPEFARGAPAYYYVRVLERPTCRWTTLQALAKGMPVPKGVPRTIRERAWGSPIYLD